MRTAIIGGCKAAASNPEYIQSQEETIVKITDVQACTIGRPEPHSGGCIWTFVRIYTDEGISGTKEDRKSLNKLLMDSKYFDIVLVHKFDRFARKYELSAKLKEKLKKNNVKVISITEPIEESPIGFFQEGLLSLLSEYYIKNLGTEVKKGQHQRIQNGEFVNKPPFGYINKDKKMIIDEKKAEIVRLMYKKYINGESANKIAEYTRKYYNIKIETYQVRRILKNKTYHGILTRNEKEYKGIHEKIISVDEYNMVQDMLSSKYKKLPQT